MWACEVDVECDHGIVDEETCRCVCKTGWWGDRCDEKCIDSRGEVACRGFAGLCNKTQYANFVLKNCPATCGICEKFGPGSEGFVCELRCSQPGGTVDAASCTCQCAKGWYGELCEEKCEDTSDKCHQWGVGQCSSASVARRCPVMCGICDGFGPGSPGYVCLKDCVNGGTMIDTDSECRCLCAKGWEGEQCEVMCENKLRRCEYDVTKVKGGSFFTRDQCYSEQSVYKNCRAMCGICEKFGPGSPGFVCTLTCLNNGTLISNATHCYCQCPNDKFGTRCADDCRDLKPRRCKRIEADECHDPFIRHNCRVTCGTCHESTYDWGEYFVVHAETPRSEAEILEERALNGNYQTHFGDGIEVIFLVDSSGSQGEEAFEGKRSMLRQFLDRLDFRAEGGLRVLFNSFAYSIRMNDNLYDVISGSKESSLLTLEALSYEGGETRLRKALKTVLNNMFVHSRDNARKVLYIMTDGLFAADDYPEAMASKMMNKGIEVYAIPTSAYYDEEVLAALTGYAINHVTVAYSAADIPLPY
ncbi:uncharacterized protein [Diadema antillarum]|uniref:uncharacterized protein n=1 Tax=Diadema antillarum TaxID=105358 RepID=UPI003A86CD50